METNNTPVSLKTVISLVVADVDIFLLKEEDQETDKDKMYSKDEIRKQLEESCSNVIEALSNLGYNVQETIKPRFIPNLNLSKL